MRKLLFKSFAIGAAALMSLAMSGCQDEDFGITVQQMENDAFKASGTFDFATSGAVTLSVDYDAPGANNPIRVYDQYPYDDEGNAVEGLEPVFAFFLKDGKFEGACNLPTATSHVWLEACGIGLPTLREAYIYNGMLTFAETRAITHNDYHDTFVGTETIVTDFSESVWKSSVLTGGKVTISDLLDWYGGASAETGTATYPGWSTSTTFFKTGGKSIIQSGKDFSRLFVFHAPSEGELKVYFTGTGNDQSRSMFITQSITATNRDESAALGNTGVTTGGSDPAVTTANVTTGDAYIWSNESCRVFKIVFKANNSEELSFADCRKVTGYDKIRQDGTKYNGIIDHIFPLYPWSMTGRPMFTLETSNTSSNVDDRWKTEAYHYYYYYDNDGNEQKYGIEQPDKYKNTPKKNADVATPVPVPDPYATVDGVGYDTRMDFTKTGALRINDMSAGTLRLLMYWGSAGLNQRRFTADGERQAVRPTNGSWTPLDNTRSDWDYVYEGTITFNNISETGYTYHTLAKDESVYILFAEYEDANGTKNSCKFDKNGIVCSTPDVFSLEEGTVCQTNPNTHNEDQMLPRTVHFTDKYNSGEHTGDYCYSSVLQDPANFTFTLPAATQAKLTIVFDDTHSNSNKTSFKLNGSSAITSTDNVYEMEIRAGDTDTEFKITKGSERNVYFIAVDYMDYIQTTDHYQQVKRFAKYDNSALADNAKLPAVTDRLRAFLWHNHISKDEAKADNTIGGNNFNLALAQQKKDEGKANQYIRVKKEAELYVTFLAEYDMRSANAFGYYYYDGSKPKPNREDLDLYIVFPNCTSTDYSNSATYKLNGSSKNAYAPGLQELVPLSNGDQVQLVYFDESGNKHEQFPAGTIVGWFLIYNGFDTWNATYNTLTTSWIQLNHQNNNHYNGTTMPHSIIYYSDPDYTDADLAVNAKEVSTDPDGTGLPRCISVTDAVTKQVSLCFEDSYYDPGMTLKKDFTYDDLLFTVTAWPSNNNIEAPNGDDSGDGSTNITYTQKGTYLFEDIWEGDETDFDLNDVAVEYTRVYTINPDNFITSIKETYKVINDGATYDDGFAVKLPYLASSIETISYSKNGSDATNLKLNITDIAPLANVSRVERDKDYLNLVVFDHINDFADNEISPSPESGTKYEYVITFKQGSQPSISKSEDVNSTTHEAGSVTFSYGRDSYNPFIIVYTYGNRVDGSAAGDAGIKRCEIHMPGKEVSQWGAVPTGSNATNNRWFVAKYGDGTSGRIFPFAVDVPIHNFTGCTEGQLVTELYSTFSSWASSNGVSNADWYSHPASGLGGWGARVK